MEDAHGYLNLTRAVDDLQTSHAHQWLRNDQRRRSVCTRAPDSGSVVTYERKSDHTFELADSYPNLARARDKLHSCYTHCWIGNDLLHRTEDTIAPDSS